MGTTDKQKSNEDGGRGECRVHGVSLDAAAVAPPQFHLDYSLTRNEWKRKERAKEGRKEGRTGPRREQSAKTGRQACNQALALYELNCPASFIMNEALRKLLPVSK